MKSIGKIAFLGAGRMATAIAGGLVKNGMNVADMSAYDISEVSSNLFEAVTGVSISSSVEEAIDSADIIVIAVKPQVIEEALKPIKGKISDKLLISIAAGVKISRLVEYSECERVIRVMPNTPALVGEGISAYCFSENVEEQNKRTAESILEAIGSYVIVNEKQIDAVTGLSGSGPAYVFSFIQALADGGVHAGLPRDVALKLSVQTVLGSAKMVLETAEHPAVLCDQVTSPGGTTAEALSVLERGAFKGTVAAAVKAAADRSIELGK